MTDTVTRLVAALVAAGLITAGLWNLFGWGAAAVVWGAALIAGAVWIPDLDTLRRTE